jgi:hypothetical protein
MTTATILLNIDLAAGTTALVSLGMILVPNIDRINKLRHRRNLTRTTVRGYSWEVASSHLVR